jgi:tRNA dimethylallyltransferase
MSELLAQREKTELPFELLSFALEPSDRAVLHERIARRFDIMLQDSPQGNLITEVEALRKRGDLHLGLPSIRCVGYRQAWEYLDGTIDYATMRETGIIATRQLAKRQLTWLRSMPERLVLDCLGPNPAGAMLAQIAERIG